MGLSGIGPKWEWAEVGLGLSGKDPRHPDRPYRGAVAVAGHAGGATATRRPVPCRTWGRPVPCRPGRCASLQIAEELAMAVARVGKHEFPAAWPMLLAMLPSAFPEGRSADAEHAYRALYTFNRILKVEESKVQPATCDVQHIARSPQRATYSMNRATSDVHHATASQSAASTARTTTYTRAPTRAPSLAHTHTHTRARTRARCRLWCVIVRSSRRSPHSSSALWAGRGLHAPPPSSARFRPPAPSLWVLPGTPCTVHTWSPVLGLRRRFVRPAALAVTRPGLCGTGPTVGHICAGTAWGEARRPT